jgi:hypothetical protein
MLALPLQLVDDFLLQYNAGQILLALFVLITLLTIPLKSRKIVGINTVVFGLILVLTPTPGLQPVTFQFIGIGLLFVGPFLIITGKR